MSSSSGLNGSGLPLRSKVQGQKPPRTDLLTNIESFVNLSLIVFELDTLFGQIIKLFEFVCTPSEKLVSPQFKWYPLVKLVTDLLSWYH